MTATARKRTRMAQDRRTARGGSRGRVWRRSSIVGQSEAFDGHVPDLGYGTAAVADCESRAPESAQTGRHRWECRKLRHHHVLTILDYSREFCKARRWILSSMG